MIGIRIGDTWLDLEVGTKIKLQLSNPLINRANMFGEYSLPFKLPSSPTNLRVLNYGAIANSASELNKSFEALLYVDGTFFSKGILKVNSYGKPYTDVNLTLNSSLLSTVKETNIRELDFGNTIDVASTHQRIEWNIDDDYIGGTLQCVIEGYGTFFQAVTTTVYAALLLLKAQVEAETFFGSETISCNPASNNIEFLANWPGIYPELRVFFNTQVGRTQTFVSQVDLLQVYQQDWQAHMNDVITQTYPAVDFMYFPVRNEGSKIPWYYNLGNDTYGEFELYFQNYYDMEESTFLPLLKEAHPLHPTGIESWLSCITPFVFVTSIFDKIGNQINAKFGGFFHSFLSIPLVVWSNYMVDLRFTTKYANWVLGTEFNVQDTLPNISIENFIKVLCDSFCLGLNPKKGGTEFTIIPLYTVLTEGDAIDWTRKVSSEVKVFPEETPNFFMSYDRSDTDVIVTDAIKILEDYEFIGAYSTFDDLPPVNTSNVDGKYFYAFVIDTNKIFIRKLIVSTVDYIWEELLTVNAPFYYFENYNAQEILAADPIAMFIGPDEYFDDEGWKIPLVKEPLSTKFLNNHSNTITKIRLLQYFGLQDNEFDHQYPMGSTVGTNYDETSVSGLDLTLQGENGLFKFFWKTWLDFLIKARRIELQINLSVLDLLSLDWSKRIHIDGSNYLIVDIKVDLPLKKPATVTLLKIE